MKLVALPLASGLLGVTVSAGVILSDQLFSVPVFPCLVSTRWSVQVPLALNPLSAERPFVVDWNDPV